MRLRELLNVPKGDLKSWGVIVPQAVADAMTAAQTGQMRVAPVPLVDGRAMFCADVLAHETGEWFSSGLALIERDDCQCARWPVCVALLDRYEGEEAPQPPEWEQILGAGLGPHGAEDGWLPESRVTWQGTIRVQRSALPAVQSPSDTEPTPWARADGVYVTPAGWQYQPGEDITEDGVTWHRVTQATSFRPSESPAQWVQITGPGGESVTAPEPDPDAVPAWEPWDGIRTPYTTGDRVTHNGATWESTTASNTWEPGVFGWVEVTDEGDLV